MQRIIILTFLISSMILFGCEKKGESIEEKEEESEHILLERSGVKVPISESGKIYYDVDIEAGAPFLESIDTFLNWYTPEELEKVEKLIIENRIPATGDIYPLKTTAGIERLQNLKEFNIGSSGIERLDGIDRLQYLEKISLLDNNISEVHGIENLKNLKGLNLIGNPISSIENIAPSEFLISIALDRTKITTLDGIERFPNLLSFGANSNALVDVTALASLKKLEGVEILSTRNNFNEESIRLMKKMKEENPDLYLEWELK